MRGQVSERPETGAGVGAHRADAELVVPDDDREALAAKERECGLREGLQGPAGGSGLR